ncbi:hypothetical protein Pelo_4819 [Pelomyxa schiedti]|nr:hypothetical protein Pelo_4819 [Pelomyxa schiedti]
MGKLVGLCGVIVVLCLVAGTARSAQQGVKSFADYFAGDWELSVTRYDETGSLEHLDTINVTFEKRNGSLTIIDGWFVGEESKGVVEIEFTSAMAGKWSEGKGQKGDNDEAAGDVEDDEEAHDGIKYSSRHKSAQPLTVAFEFAFSNTSNGYFFSSGPYAGTGEVQHFYQFLVASLNHPAFMFTISDKEGEMVKMISGKKLVGPVQKSFFQRYGIIIMMGSFILLQLIKGRFSGGQPAAPAAASTTEAAAATTPAPAAASTTAAPATAAPATTSSGVKKTKKKTEGVD